MRKCRPWALSRKETSSVRNEAEFFASLNGKLEFSLGRSPELSGARNSRRLVASVLGTSRRKEGELERAKEH